MAFNDNEKQAMKDYLAGLEGDNGENKESEEEIEDGTPPMGGGEGELPVLPA